MRFINISLTVVTALSIVLGTQRVHGLAGTLDHPSLSFPQDEKDVDQEEVMKVLGMKEAQFLGGRFVNAFTTLQYGGDTDALNRFLARLSACKGTSVVVTYHETPGGDTSTWWLQHNAWGNPKELVVSIDAKSPRFDPSLFKLPAEAKSEPSRKRFLGGTVIGKDGKRRQ